MLQARELIRERDYGTPHVAATETVTLTIDGQSVTVPRGTSLMRAAAELGVSVPKLCATDSLEAFGSCRVCLVEIDGRRGYPASCTTPAEDGMTVRTQSPKLAQLRQGVMELYLSDHPAESTLPDDGSTRELHDMARALGVTQVRYRQDDGHCANHLGASRDESNPYFSFDPAQCIVCSRCVRACEEIQGTFALTI